MFIVTRCQFLQWAVAAAPFLIRRPLEAQTADPWQRAGTIAKRVTVPRFARRDFKITKYGAVGNGAKSCTGAIRQAIAACRAAGGGRVIVPTAGSSPGPYGSRAASTCM